MSGIFTNAASQVSQAQRPLGNIRLQTSVQGKPIPIGYGQNRIAANVIWMDGQAAYTVSSTSVSGGGKGGGSSGKSAGGATANANQQITYSVNFLLAFCEGPTAVGPPTYVYNGNSVEVFSTANLPGNVYGVNGEYNFGYVDGSYGQGVLPFLTTHYPSAALAYRGMTYIPATPIYLGASTVLPPFSVSMTFAINSTLPGLMDAGPPLIIDDFLTNVYYGVGFPSSRLHSDIINDTGPYAFWCYAQDLVLSPIIDTQKAATDYLQEWMQATYSQFVWSSGVLKVVPYGDQGVSGNGFTYTPPAFAPYSISDFHLGKGSHQIDDPVVVSRKRMEDVNNTVRIEYLDAHNAPTAMGYFNPWIVEAKDDALINTFGIKAKATQQMYGYTYGPPVTTIANLLLQRETQILNSYEFTVSGRYILLDPMDIVEINDPVLGMVNFPVRITEITENDDYTLTIQAEDFPAGAATSPSFASEPGATGALNYNSDPGFINPPLIWEPTDLYAGGLFVYMAITPQNIPAWGGCEVWASYDNITYQKIGVQRAITRLGFLTQAFPGFVPTPNTPFIDQTNFIFADFGLSQAVITSGSLADVSALNTLLYLFDTGEYVAYLNATPTGTYQYEFSYLNRAAYGSSSAGTCPLSSYIIRLDQAVFQIPYTPDRIGTSVSLKFLSFNIYGGARQGLEDVPAYTYAFAGTALTSPLPDVQNFVTSYVGGITYLDWDPVTDFRSPIFYEIRKGAAWTTSQFFGLFAHGHHPATGDDTYWIKAVCRPVPGLIVYSEDAVSWDVINSVITENLLAEFIEDNSGANWDGALVNLVRDGPFISTQQTTTDLLLAPDVLPLDWLASTGTVIGYYYSVNVIDSGYVCPQLIQVIYQGNGQGTTDFFNPGPPNNNDIFAHADIFDELAGTSVNIYPEIALSQDGGLTYGPYQKYQPGQYVCRTAQIRMVLQSNDSANVIAVLTQMIIAIYLQTRVDHPLINSPISAAVNTITFAPDGAASPAPFNSGPNAGTTNISPGVTITAGGVPGVQVDINNRAAGDQLFIAGLTKASVSVEVTNNVGTPVARNVTMQVWGF
jgi:hypothetical protein